MSHASHDCVVLNSTRCKGDLAIVGESTSWLKDVGVGNEKQACVGGGVGAQPLSCGWSSGVRLLGGGS
jgi:hypothetical protein